MPRDGSKTREKIMDAAQQLILEQGFAASSVDKIIEQAGVTKGTFFYHFPGKQLLAQALVDRWAEWDRQHLDGKLARAEAASADPLERLLRFVGYFEEEVDNYVSEAAPGCLLASYCYEAELFDADTHARIRATYEMWPRTLVPYFEAAADRYPPRLKVDFREVVEMLTALFEGGFILVRVYGDKRYMKDQLRQYRNYLALLFGAEPRPA